MTARNGSMWPRYERAFVARTYPRTGITQKMLENETGISDATLGRYLRDETTIPGRAVELIDAAFTKYRMPGFLAEVFPCLPSAGTPPAAPAAADSRAGGAAFANPAAGGDLCLWATHLGDVPRALNGHGEFALRYLNLPVDTDADPRRFVMEQLGWVQIRRLPDGRIQVDGSRVNAAAREVAADWLLRQGDAEVFGSAVSYPMPAAMAAEQLRLGAALARPQQTWTTTPLDLGDVEDEPSRELWRAIHAAGVERAHFLETADRVGAVQHCAMFLVDGERVTSLHVGSALPIDGSVVGRDVMSRQDIAYALRLRRGVLDAAKSSSITRLRRFTDGVEEGGYDRMAIGQRLGPDRYRVLTVSSRIILPENFQDLR